MTTLAISKPEVIQPSRLTLLFRYLRRNKSLAIGLLIVLLLTVFTVVGMLTIDTKPRLSSFCQTETAPQRPIPVWHRLFRARLAGSHGGWPVADGTHRRPGRRLGTLIGVVLGFTSAYFGGIVDSVIKGICQILTPIPPS